MDLNNSYGSARAYGSPTGNAAEGGSPPCMPHQWERNTRTLVDSARKAQSLSSQQRVMSFGTQRATDETMINDNKTSSTALMRNISESQALMQRSEAQLEAILRETSMLEDEAAHAEATHEKMKDPLAVAEENLNIRRKRPPRELTRDAVERALNEQVAGAKVRCLLGLDALISFPLSAQSLEYNLGTYEVWLCAQHSIRMLGGVLDACEKELARLKICREKLEEDIDQVSQAYPACLSHQPCAECSI